jgi:ATP-dependent Lon protease
MPGKGKLVVTGRLGNVMKESVHAALSYARAKAKLESEDFYGRDLHINVPSASMRKDGPSAGITMATALVSLFTGKAVRRDVGMTGEITLRGEVAEIGGVKEKVLAAYRAGLKTIILPQQNKKDLNDIPKEVRKKLKFAFVKNIDQALKIALK